MVITDFYLALVIGLTVGLLFSELTGISLGGVIVPCYVGLVMDTPDVLLSILLVSLLTYLIVAFILPKYMVLFGRRKFVATIMVAIIIKLLLELVYPAMPFSIFLFRGIGILIPALLCNAYIKQGISLTVVSVLSMSAVVYACLGLVHFFY